MSGMGDQSLITFATKPHENGDRLLVVKMPDQRLSLEPDQPITTFQTGSREELLLKRAIQAMAIRFFVEIEQPLLRTNAPARKGNRATILDLDLDKMVNAMDEPKVRRMMSPGSLQEMLWQVGDLPGAVVPVDHEIFLEYEAPQAPPQPPPAPAVQAPPDTEIYLAPMKTANGAIEIGPAVDITNNPGYDNQPFFTPDGKAILFTSIRGSGRQTDIYKYDIAAKTIAQLTNTPESEYSPTITPGGKLSVIRVELDADKTQRLWQFTADGRDPQPVLETIKPVGYHAWADHQTLVLFVLGASTGPGAGEPATLQLADTRTGTAVVLASDVGRSIQRIPVNPADSRWRRGQRDQLRATRAQWRHRESGDQGTGSFDAPDLDLDRRRRGQHRGRLRLDAGRHAADGARGDALRLAAGTIGMERNHLA